MNLKLFKYIISILAISFVFSNQMIAQDEFGSNQVTTDNGFLSDVKPKLSVSLSSSFSSFGYGVSAFGTTILPKVSFPVSKKFAVSVGVGYSSLFINSYGGSALNSAPNNYGHVFISGDYYLNEKITLRGTAYKTFGIGQPNFSGEPGSQSPIYDLSSQGVILDVEYKVTDNFHINVGFEYRKQNHPIYSPGMGPSIPGSFGNNSFFELENNRNFNSF